MQRIFREKSWYEFPLVKTCCFFIAGLVVGKYVPILSITQMQYLLISSFIIFMLLRFPSYHLAYQIQTLTASLLYLIILFVGMLYMQHRLAEIPTQSAIPKQNIVLVQIEEHPQTNKKSISTIARIVQWKESKTNKERSGLIRIYFPLTINQTIIKPSNWMLLYKTPSLIPTSPNTNFNYQRYAFTQGIYYQVYIQQSDFQLIKKKNAPILSNSIFYTKTLMISTIEKYISSKQAAGIAEALLIGYKKNVDKSLLDAYSKTGIIHIIAISGMHLGMIYLLILKLLHPFRNKNIYPLLEFTIVIILIWLFTILTGAAPSIVRAAIIFSCMSMGKLLHRKHHSFNALALASICILCYNPLFIEDIGFQLSFAAVISIVCFYLPIKKSVFVQNKILLLCWESVAITLAAQILTLPLLLYHFHQFPIIFIFTNFIAIPISGAVLYLEILLLVASPIPNCALFIGKLIESLISWLNNWVTAIANLPFISISGISINIPQTIALYIFILILTRFRREKYA